MSAQNDENLNVILATLAALACIAFFVWFEVKHPCIKWVTATCYSETCTKLGGSRYCTSQPYQCDQCVARK